MTFYSTTAEVGLAASDAFAKVGCDHALSADQADLTLVLLFITIGVLLVATLFTANPLPDLGQILAVSG